MSGAAPRSYVIGLTGGIASGKTLVADAFAELGVPLLDADHVARDVVAPGEPALAGIAETFGPQFLQADGSLNRRRLRERVFGDAEALRQLEAITHPAIRARIRRWLDEQTAPYCILSAALLLGGPLRSWVDRVLVVDVSPEVQQQRLMQRDIVDADLAQRIIAAQAAREVRLAAADDVLLNDGSLQQAHEAVAQLHRAYIQLTKSQIRH